MSHFWTSGDVWPQFQSQCGSLACMLHHLYAMDFLRYTSEAIPADLLAASMAPEPFGPDSYFSNLSTMTKRVQCVTSSF